MAFLWKYWTKSGSQADQQTVHSNTSSEDFVYNEYESRDAERRAAPHHIQKHAPPAHGQAESRRLMHRRSRRREEGQDLDSLRETMKEQGRRSSRNRSLCHVRERTTSVSQPNRQSSTTSSAQGRTGHMARVWTVDSEVESVNFVVGRPKPARLREVRAFVDESDGSSVVADTSGGSGWMKTPEMYVNEFAMQSL